MRNITTSLFLIHLLFLFYASELDAQEKDSIQNGYIVAIGGGIDDKGLDQFLALIGDSSNSIVIVPTACYDQYIHGELNCATHYEKYFDKKGYHNYQVLHTRSVDSANSPTFILPLKKAKGVWFTGGRQPLLADSYLNTLFHNQLRSILAQGGVIGGSSAGATIMGSFMVRGQLRNNTIMIGDHTVGFGFLNNTAIDQHLLVRNRQFDLLEVTRKHPDILGIGIDEGTTIVVHKNVLEVVDGNYVAIYDGTFWNRETFTTETLARKSKRFYFLKSYDLYDLTKREVLTHLNKKAIDLPTEQLEKFQGSYRFGNDKAFIELKGNELEMNGVSLFPISNLEFFKPDNPNRYVFTKNAKGEVNGLNIISYKAFFYEKMD